MTPERYLQLQFIKGIRRKHVANAELAPKGTDALLSYMAPNEHCIVAVRDKQGRRLWFTNVRLIFEERSDVTELFEYGAVRNVHWMFKDFWDGVRTDSEKEIARTKLNHFDRLEVELKAQDARLVILEGLDQSYLPIFQFLQFLAQNRLA